MTSLKASEKTTTRGPISARADDDGLCEKCKSPLKIRQAHPYPVTLQIIFALSFAAFLWAQSAIKLPSPVFWLWTTAQIILGVLLVRARLRSSKRILICIRCNPPLR